MAGWRRFAEQTRALVGERDPLEIMGEQVGVLRALLQGFSESDYRTPEGEGKWSAAQVIPHLVDTELAWAFRIRQVVVEDAPPMQGFDQGRWVTEFGYANESREGALALLSLLRERNLRFFRSLSDAQWERCGVHADRGPESLRDIARLMAGHDLRHRRQLERLRQTLGIGAPDSALGTTAAGAQGREAVRIRAAHAGDRDGIVALTPRLESFGLPGNVEAGSIADGEARALSAALASLPDGAALLVAVDPSDATLGVLFLETKVDYFTERRHGHVGVLAVAAAAEGRGVGRALLAAADDWASRCGYDRLTLHVFEANARARAVYARAGYAPDLVRYRKDVPRDA